MSRITEALQVAGRVVRAAAPRRRRAADGPSAVRHLAVVSWHFPPEWFTGAQLPAFLARQAVREGWRVTVLCGPERTDAGAPGREAARLLPPEVRLVRAQGGYDASGDFHPQFPHRLSPRVDGGFSEMVSMADAGLRALSLDPPSHVFATGPVFGNFEVARRLAGHFGVPLSLQYRDEWTVMRPSFVDVAPGHVEREASCLRRAALVTFVTEGKAALYRAAFPFLAASRIAVVPNGWDPDVVALAADGSGHLAHLRGRDVLLFTGRATDEIPIGPLLDLLEVRLGDDAGLRARLTLVVAGTQTPETASHLARLASRFPGTVETHPAVSQVAAIEMMREAGAVLLLNNTRHAGVVPLKTFDYMVSGAPILAFGETGEAGTIVSGTGAGVVVPDGDATALARALGALLRDRGRWRTPARADWCRVHDRAILTRRLLEAIADAA